MANPQLEHGYTRIANEIMEALARTNLSPYQSRILFVIWRKTYGWKKKQDRISISQIVELTDIHKANVSRTLKQLVDRKIVIRTDNSIAFNKNYTQWKELSKLITPQKPVISTDYKKLSVQTDTKEKKEKNNTSPYGEEQATQLEEAKKEIFKLARILKASFIFEDAEKFAGKMLTRKKHPGAVIYALMQCMKYKPKEPYPYCLRICQRESGNLYESEHHLRTREEYGEGRQD